MAAALRGGAPPRATGRLALHALEVMEAIVTGGSKNGFTAIANGAERPAALSEDDAAKLFAR
jgi:hypothetical protein